MKKPRLLTVTANMKNSQSLESPICPVPVSHREQIIMGHGSGGKLSHDLINNLFLPPFDNLVLRAGNDAGVVQTAANERIAISTDSHVVWPLFFPGGDIGRLAICGTVNDVAMMGAKPLYITAGFILEEGLELDILERVVVSMREAALEAGVMIVAGDTKVVEKGKADGIFINTAGIGLIPDKVDIEGRNAQPGDVIILSGPIGNHGIAVLGARGELGFKSNIESDVSPLNHLVEAMMDVSDQIHVLRDPTRGGIASALNEVAQQSRVGIIIDEERIPVCPAVRAACEMLGFDPLYIANEGKLLAIVAREDTTNILEAMRTKKYGEEAVVIGEIQPEPRGRTLMRTAIGSTRIVDMLSGEMLPRIC